MPALVEHVDDERCMHVQWRSHGTALHAAMPRDAMPAPSDHCVQIFRLMRMLRLYTQYRQYERRQQAKQALQVRPTHPLVCFTVGGGGGWGWW